MLLVVSCKGSSDSGGAGERGPAAEHGGRRAEPCALLQCGEARFQRFNLCLLLLQALQQDGSQLWIGQAEMAIAPANDKFRKNGLYVLGDEADLQIRGPSRFFLEPIPNSREGQEAFQGRAQRLDVRFQAPIGTFTECPGDYNIPIRSETDLSESGAIWDRGVEPQPRLAASVSELIDPPLLISRSIKCQVWGVCPRCIDC